MHSFHNLSEAIDGEVLYLAYLTLTCQLLRSFNSTLHRLKPGLKQLRFLDILALALKWMFQLLETVSRVEISSHEIIVVLIPQLVIPPTYNLPMTSPTKSSQRCCWWWWWRVITSLKVETRLREALGKAFIKVWKLDDRMTMQIGISFKGLQCVSKGS